MSNPIAVASGELVINYFKTRVIDVLDRPALVGEFVS
jgi:hypothetical protein